jgi:hypothetical protein
MSKREQRRAKESEGEHSEQRGWREVEAKKREKRSRSSAHRNNEFSHHTSQRTAVAMCGLRILLGHKLNFCNCHFDTRLYCGGL